MHSAEECRMCFKMSYEIRTIAQLGRFKILKKEGTSLSLNRLIRLLVSYDDDDVEMNFRSPNKIESKYGVVSDYTNLNLHQAAFTNDVGSAAFALRNGQPQNSVYKGTLPIHAASLAGSRDVLRMLIDAGADVNAPRYGLLIN